MSVNELDTKDKAEGDIVENEAPASTATALHRREFLKRAMAVTGAAVAGPALLGSMFASPAGAARLTLKKPLDPETIIRVSDTPGLIGPMQTIEAQDFDAQLATVEGISQNQLKQHLGLYQGYVKRINEIHSQLQTGVVDVAKANTTFDVFRELHVEQSFALNGVVLHELYFANLGHVAASKGASNQPSALTKDLIERAFGSWANYITHLKAAGKSMRGWVITGFNLRDGRIHNYGLDSHNIGVPVHVLPLLVLDVWEHAYMIDFGTKRPDYLEAFIANICWTVVNQRFEAIPAHLLGVKR